MKAAWLQIVLSLLTNIPSLVAEVEAADPKVPGEGKKLIVMDKIKTALVGLDPVVGPLLVGHIGIMDSFSTAVNVAVDIFNGSAKVVQDSQGGTPVTGAPTPGLPGTTVRSGA
jgi:hypothetical protein